MKKRIAALLLLLSILVFSLTIPAIAASDDSEAQLDYVTDIAGILTNEELNELENEAASISSTYACSTYILVLDNYRLYTDSDSTFSFCMETYEKYNLGWGADKDGILLMLSMSDRDYYLIIHGDGAGYAFTQDGRDQMQDRFLTYFGRDDYYGGFRKYLSECRRCLQAAANGKPIDPFTKNDMETLVFLCLAPSLLLAVVVGYLLYKPMRTAVKQSSAGSYIVPGSTELRQRSDQFSHRTVRRRPRQSDSEGSSGRSHDSSGGYSGSGGKF